MGITFSYTAIQRKSEAFTIKNLLFSKIRFSSRHEQKAPLSEPLRGGFYCFRLSFASSSALSSATLA